MKYLKYNTPITNATFSKGSRGNRGPPMKAHKDADDHISRERDEINVDL